jgi:hypothetical protein
MGVIFELPIGNMDLIVTDDILPGFDSIDTWSNVLDDKMTSVDTKNPVVSSVWNNMFLYVTDSGTVTTTIINMMVYFIGTDESQKYPESSPYLCHNCCHSFKSIPCFIPTKIHVSRDNKYSFNVRGNFCSFNCALTEVINFPKRYSHDTIELLRHMYSLVIPKDNCDLIPAQQKETLKSFGGVLSIDEYRNLFFEMNTTMDIVFPPIVTNIPILEKTAITPVTRNLVSNEKKKLVQTTIYSS